MRVGSLLRRKVCVVSEREDLRELLAALIEADGYQVANAATGEAGLDRAARFRPHAVVVEAPSGKAKDLINRLRSRPELSACGLLVISATLDVPIASQGAWAPFAKPFDLLKLKSAVAAAAARPGQRF